MHPLLGRVLRSWLPQSTTGGRRPRQLLGVTQLEDRLAPAVDLRPTELSVTGPLVVGQTVTITWAGTNAGDTASPPLGWSDSLYFSADATFDRTDQLLHTETILDAAALPAGATYTRSKAVPLNVPTSAGYLLVVTDLSERITEGNEANNTRVLPLVLATPDLTVSGFTGPASADAGQPIDLSWVVSNVGAAAYTQTWQSNVYLSADATYDTADTLVRTGGSGSNLAAGGSVPQTAVTAAPTAAAAGDYFLIVRAERYSYYSTQYAETRTDNNTAAIPFRIRTPDLRVGGLTGPAAATAGQSVDISFVVSNAGTTPVYDATGVSAVAWVAKDAAGANRVASTGVSLGTDARLPVNGSVTRTATLTLPTNLTGGTYYYGVTVGAGRADGNAADNAASTALTVTALPTSPPPTPVPPPPAGPQPDLTVALTGTPARVFPGDTLSATVVVTNAGAAAVPSDEYESGYVYVYLALSADAVLDDDDTYLAYQYASAGGTAWEPGTSRSVTLATELSRSTTLGAGYLIASVTPYYFAESDSNNNTAVAAVTVAPLTPGAGVNLTATAVSLPNGLSVAGYSTATWTVRATPTPAAGGKWEDRVYLSADATLNTATDLLAGTKLISASDVRADGTYSASAEVYAPYNPNQYRYVFVVANARTPADDPNPADNTASAAVTLTAPDLIPTVSVVPSTQGLVKVTASVRNAGPVSASRSSWSDLVYLSADAVLDSNDTYLGGFSRYGALAAGESYTTGGDVSLAGRTIAGGYLLFITDGNNYSSYSSYVEESDEVNNVAAVRLTAAGLPDFRPTAATASKTTVRTGESITVSWTIANDGTAVTGTLYDSVYLSDDTTFDPTDEYVGYASGNGLAAGASVNRTGTVSIPSGTGGTKYLLVVANRYSTNPTYNLPEADTGNNTRAVAITVTGADLVVDSATASASAGAVGQSVEVTWAVRNAGEDAALADWYDTVYFSTDATLDSSDVNLGQFYAGAETPLDLGEAYSRTQAFTLPSTLTAGAGFLIVRTDGYYYSYYEGDTGSQAETNEANNTRAIPFTVGVPDLTVAVADWPAELTAGQSADFSWTVSNSSAVAAPGDRYDAVYLSLDATFDGGDAELAEFYRSGITTAGGSYTASQTVTVPGLRPGRYFLIYTADANGTLTESDETNNARVVPVTVHAPDLVVTDFTFPTSAVPGSTVTATWTVKNVGDAAAPAGGWLDRLTEFSNSYYYSTSELAAVAYTGPALAPGASYTVTRQVTTSPAFGTGYYYGGASVTLRVNNGNGTAAQPRFADGDTGNDARTRTLTITPPDLKIVSFTAPTTVAAGQTYTVSWEVTNAGQHPALGDWSDAIDLNGTRLATRARTVSPLAAGTGYTATAEVMVPANFAGGAATFRLSVDVNAYQGESDENNNTATVATTVGSANLTVTALTASSTAVTPGQTITVSWTVTNAGTTPAVADWADALLLLDSPDQTLSYYYNGQPIATEGVTAQTPLAAGASYTVTKTVTIPTGVTGTKHLTLLTDAGYQSYYFYFTSQQGETNEGDNRRSVALTIGAPDLELTTATAPPVLAVGSPAEFTWTVSNTATDPAAADWTDSVYLSADDTLDSSDRLVLSEPIAAQTPLTGGASYTVTRTATVPAATGDVNYVLFVTDRSGAQAERSEANNTRALPVSLRGPDLVVSAIDAPPAARSGDPFTLTWTVTNTGSADATGTWTDRVYSSKDRFGVNVRHLSDFAFTGTIAAGESVTRTQAVNAPIDLVGGFYLLVAADVGNALAEQDNTNNTRLTARKTQFGQQEYPDLKVTTVGVPPQAFSGQEVSATWTVTNAGSGATSSPVWYDRVWLSADAVLDNSDTFLGDVANPAYLPPGEGYNSGLTARLPRDAEGTYYILVEADRHGQVFELNRDANNRTASAGFTVTLTPPPDLRVTSVVAPSSTFSGQPTALTWTVTNAGRGPTDATGWYDEVFLSADDRVDPSDWSLGRVARGGALAADGTYTASLSVVTPVTTQGAFFLLVRTDTLNQVFEQAFEGNNVGHDDPTAILLTPPPDLEVTALTVPPTAVAGQPIALRYAAQNLGAGEVPNAGWTDAFYLSTSPTFDPAAARLLGTRGNAEPRGVSASDGSAVDPGVIFTLPADLPTGNYYVYVVADSTAQVFESDEANNVRRSAGTVAVASRPADLRVTAVVPAGPAEAGQTLTFTYTVQNSGNGRDAGERVDGSVRGRGRRRRRDRPGHPRARRHPGGRGDVHRDRDRRRAVHPGRRLHAQRPHRHRQRGVRVGRRKQCRHRPDHCHPPCARPDRLGRVRHRPGRGRRHPDRLLAGDEQRRRCHPGPVLVRPGGADQQCRRRGGRVGHLPPHQPTVGRGVVLAKRVVHRAGQPGAGHVLRPRDDGRPGAGDGADRGREQQRPVADGRGRHRRPAPVPRPAGDGRVRPDDGRGRPAVHCHVDGAERRPDCHRPVV